MKSIKDSIFEAIASRKVGKYGPKLVNKPYSDMSFKELCNDMSYRDYYYKMTEDEAEQFVSAIGVGDFREAWRYLTTEIRGGDGLWYGDPYLKTMWIVTVSSHSALVDIIEWDNKDEIHVIEELTIPVNRNQMVWNGNKLNQGIDMLEKLLEK